VGTTQYIDAYQRANFWSIVQNNPNSHLLLSGPSAGVRVLPELTLNVPANLGKQGVEGGVNVALADINYFDAQLYSYMVHNNVINPTGFPIFETANTYLVQGDSCCIGGYHGANGAQTYAHFTYITTPGAFARTYLRYLTKWVSGLTIRCIRSRTTPPAAAWKTGIHSQAVNRVILTARGNMYCMGSHITCRTW